MDDLAEPAQTYHGDTEARRKPQKRSGDRAWSGDPVVGKAKFHRGGAETRREPRRRIWPL